MLIVSITCCFRHFFFTAMLFVYGRILSQQLVDTVTSEKFFYKLLSGFIKYQMVICYFLYIAGWFISYTSSHSVTRKKKNCMSSALMHPFDLSHLTHLSSGIRTVLFFYFIIEFWLLCACFWLFSS